MKIKHLFLILILICLILIPSSTSEILPKTEVLDRIIYLEDDTITGFRDYEIITNTSVTNSNNKDILAYCSIGRNVTGGGCEISSSAVDVALQSNYPVSNYWKCYAVESDPVGASWNVTAYAICANINE